MILKRKLILLVGAGLLAVLAGVFILRRSPLRRIEVPKPPFPEAFPSCPEVPLADYDWHGLRFKFYRGWRPELIEKDYPATRIRDMFIIPGDGDKLESFHGVFLSESAASRELAQAIDEVWRLPEGQIPDVKGIEMMRNGGIPETIRRLRVSGKPAVLYLNRGMGLMAYERDSWELLVKGSKAYYEIASPMMFNPYGVDDKGRVVFNKETAERNSQLACHFWAVARSLRVP